MLSLFVVAVVFELKRDNSASTRGKRRQFEWFLLAMAWFWLLIYIEMKTVIAQSGYIALVAVLLLVVGCQAERPSFAAYSVDDNAKGNTQYHRPMSLALDSRGMAKAMDKANMPGGQSQWYETRNDYSLETYAGHRSAIVEHSYTRVHDRQYNSSNRVHNYYNESTWQYRSVGTSQ